MKEPSVVAAAQPDFDQRFGAQARKLARMSKVRGRTPKLFLQRNFPITFSAAAATPTPPPPPPPPATRMCRDLVLDVSYPSSSSSAASASSSLSACIVASVRAGKSRLASNQVRVVVLRADTVDSGGGGGSLRFRFPQCERMLEWMPTCRTAQFELCLCQGSMTASASPTQGSGSSMMSERDFNQLVTNAELAVFNSSNGVTVVARIPVLSPVLDDQTHVVRDALGRLLLHVRASVHSYAPSAAPSSSSSSSSTTKKRRRRRRKVARRVIRRRQHQPARADLFAHLSRTAVPREVVFRFPFGGPQPQPFRRILHCVDAFSSSSSSFGSGSGLLPHRCPFGCGSARCFPSAMALIVHVHFEHCLEEEGGGWRLKFIPHGDLVVCEVTASASASASSAPPLLSLPIRKYYKSTTLQPLFPSELDDNSDFEDAHEDHWRSDKADQLLGEFTDLKAAERDYMSLWNDFVLHHAQQRNSLYHVSDGELVRRALPQFLHEHRQMVAGGGGPFRHEFVVHLLNLVDMGVLSAHELQEVLGDLNGGLQ